MVKRKLSYGKGYAPNKDVRRGERERERDGGRNAREGGGEKDRNEGSRYYLGTGKTGGRLDDKKRLREGHLDGSNHEAHDILDTDSPNNDINN
jgi:hypothetical protein